MKKYILLISGILSVTLSAQKQHDLSLGAGFIQTMNSSTLPAGLRGINTVFNYQYTKQSAKQPLNTDAWFVDGQFAFLINNYPFVIEYYNLNFRYTELSAGYKWLRTLFDNQKFNFYAGAGASVMFLLHFQTNINFYSHREFNWYLSPDIYAGAGYRLCKTILKGELSFPLLAAGNFTNQFHYPRPASAAAVVKYKITPNTLVFAGKLFNPKFSLSALYPVKTGLYLKARYTFESFDLKLNLLRQKTEQHSLSIGAVWSM
jgi:hypothetical protein